MGIRLDSCLPFHHCKSSEITSYKCLNNELVQFLVKWLKWRSGIQSKGSREKWQRKYLKTIKWCVNTMTHQGQTSNNGEIKHPRLDKNYIVNIKASVI